MNIEALARHLAYNAEGDFELWSGLWPDYGTADDYLAVRKIFNTRLPKARQIAQEYADILSGI